MAIYLKIDKIDGPVTTKGFEKQIEILSFSLGTSRMIGTAARGSTNREHAEPTLSEVTLTKNWDTASANLFQDAVAGTMDKKAILTFTTTSKGATEKFLEIDMENVGLSSYQLGGGMEGPPTESISLNFTKISYTPYAIDVGGKATKGTPVNYDLTLMKANA